MATTSLLPLESATVSLETIQDSARRYVQQAKSERTVKAYKSDWLQFVAFCEQHGKASLPARPETVALYLAACADAGSKVATLSRRLASISKSHAVAGHDSPSAMRHACVKEVWSGIRRTKGIAQTVKSAVTTDYLKRMLNELPDTLTGIRDRSLLILGFAGALRRSELVALNLEDVQFEPEGLILTINKSKTDQERAGQKIGITFGKNPETCPVRALRTWLQATGIQCGPIFRKINRHGQLGTDALTDQVVANQVKHYAELASLDPSLFSGHSLRAGLATSAAQAGQSERKIQNQTRHRSLAMVNRYIRNGNLFIDNVSAAVGL